MGSDLPAMLSDQCTVFLCWSAKVIAESFTFRLLLFVMILEHKIVSKHRLRTFKTIGNISVPRSKQTIKADIWIFFKRRNISTTTFLCQHKNTTHKPKHRRILWVSFGQSIVDVKSTLVYVLYSFICIEDCFCWHIALQNGCMECIRGGVVQICILRVTSLNMD